MSKRKKRFFSWFLIIVVIIGTTLLSFFILFKKPEKMSVPKGGSIVVTPGDTPSSLGAKDISSEHKLNTEPPDPTSPEGIKQQFQKENNYEETQNGRGETRIGGVSDLLNGETDGDTLSNVEIFPEVDIHDFYGDIRIKEGIPSFTNDFVADVINFVVNNLQISHGGVGVSWSDINSPDLDIFFRWIKDEEHAYYKTYHFHLSDLSNINV